jgi:hypothetical protein
MNKTFENKFFLLCTALVLTFSGLFYASAAEEESATIVDGVDYACGQKVMEEAFVVIEAYQTFLDEYFQADRPSSEQAADAMSYYRYMRDSINAIYEAASDVRTNNTLESAATATTYCSSVRDQYIELAQTMLQKQVVMSSNSKRTFKVIDGLKAINESMDVFADSFNATFPVLFNKMSNALPCYARQCLVQ